MNKKSKILLANKEEFNNIISKIFKLNKKIRFVAIISDNGKILSCQMRSDTFSLLKKENEKKFCNDIIKRKIMRQGFNNSLGKVRYVNVERENITQIVTYINSKTIFVTSEPELSVNTKELLISKIKKTTESLK